MPSWGQGVCATGTAKGFFSLEKAKVCFGTPVKITGVPSTISNTGYDFNYDGRTLDKVRTVTSTTFSYTAPGTYTILQVGSGAGLSEGTIYCQTVEVLPLGKVNFTVRACAGRQATIVPALDETNNKYDTYQISWGDGVVESKKRADFQANVQHTYANNGPYTVTVVGVYGAPANCSGLANSAPPISFVGTQTQPTINRLTTVNDNTITLDFQASNGARVQLLQRDASGVYAPTSQTGLSSGTMTVTTNAKQTQCFQLTTQDACGTAGQPSEQVCSLVLNATAASKQNNLSWDAYQGTSTPFRYYRIYRNGSPTNGLIANRNTTTTTDANRIECGTNYCYTLEVTAGPTIVTSASTCVTGIDGDKPTGFTNALVSIEDGKPRVIAGLPATSPSSSYSMVVSRAPAGSTSFQPIGTIGTNAFTDATVDPGTGSYCYVVAYQNKCGQLSDPTKPVCTVLLDSKSAGGIDWTSASPFSNSAVSSYTLEILDTGSNTKKEIPLGTSTHYEPDPNAPVVQTQQYRIIAVDQNGVVSYSNYYTLRIASKVFVPDAFTPNGDQANDVFLVRGLIGDTFRMTIFSRWGEVVYNTTDKTKGWDGLINGEPAMAGQYMYRIEVQDLEGTQTVKTGALLLLR
ncbi:hypothetical protein GCM10027578_45010 [Spirosoma luteolum]